MARYQYETSPRKIRTDYEPVRKKAVKKSSTKNVKTIDKPITKTKKVSKTKVVFFVLIGFMAFFTISYRNAVIDSKYAEIKSLRKNLAMVEKENEQLEAAIESCLNLRTIQEEAENLLGMKTLSNDQIKYVSLPKIDYVESSSEEVKIEKESSFTKVLNLIKSLVK